MARDPTRLSVVVVAYRSPDLLVEAIRSLGQSSRLPDEIIAADVEPDGPAPLPAGDLTDLAPVSTTLVGVPGNPGYAAACNRAAAATNGDWILFMNADVTVAPECLEAVLADATAADDIGVATCRLMRPDGRIDHACHRGIPTPLELLAYKLRLHRLAPRSRRLAHYTLSWLDLDDTHDIEACSGAFLLIRRDAFEAVGGWDERYWFYAEDLDLCLRVSQAGWRIRYVGSATALHLKSASSHLQQDEAALTPDERASRRRVQRAIVESHESFYRAHQEDSTARPIRPFVGAMFRYQRWRTGLAR